MGCSGAEGGWGGLEELLLAFNMLVCIGGSIWGMNNVVEGGAGDAGPLAGSILGTMGVGLADGVSVVEAEAVPIEGIGVPGTGRAPG